MNLNEWKTVDGAWGRCWAWRPGLPTCVRPLDDRGCCQSCIVALAAKGERLGEWSAPLDTLIELQAIRALLERVVVKIGG